MGGRGAPLRQGGLCGWKDTLCKVENVFLRKGTRANDGEVSFRQEHRSDYSKHHGGAGWGELLHSDGHRTRWTPSPAPRPCPVPEVPAGRSSPVCLPPAGRWPSAQSARRSPAKPAALPVLTAVPLEGRSRCNGEAPRQ